MVTSIQPLAGERWDGGAFMQEVLWARASTPLGTPMLSPNYREGTKISSSTPRKRSKQNLWTINSLQQERWDLEMRRGFVEWIQGRQNSHKDRKEEEMETRANQGVQKKQQNSEWFVQVSCAVPTTGTATSQVSTPEDARSSEDRQWHM
jgi:hypothetical protein